MEERRKRQPRETNERRSREKHRTRTIQWVKKKWDAVERKERNK